MTSSVNRVLSFINASQDVPYLAVNPSDLLYGPKGKRFSLSKGLSGYIHQRIQVVYVPCSAITESYTVSGCSKDEILKPGVLENIRVQPYAGRVKNHIFNLIRLKIRDEKAELIFVDGEVDDLKMPGSSKALGLIKRVQGELDERTSYETHKPDELELYLDKEIPYEARNCSELSAGHRKSPVHTGLTNYVRRKVKVTYIPKNSKDGNQTEEIKGLLEAVLITPYHEVGNFNLVSLRLQEDKKKRVFVDGVKRHLESPYSSEALGLIKRVQRLS